jgi:hypothetical protein
MVESPQSIFDEQHLDSFPFLLVKAFGPVWIEVFGIEWSPIFLGVPRNMPSLGKPDTLQHPEEIE